MVPSASPRSATVIAAGVALALLVGVSTFLLTRDSAPRPVAASTTTSAPPAGADAADVVAEALTRGLSPAVTETEAECLAQGLLDLVPAPILAELAPREEPLTGVAPSTRALLVRVVVTCLPETTAAALLGSPTTTIAPTGLPDEG